MRGARVKKRTVPGDDCLFIHSWYDSLVSFDFPRFLIAFLVLVGVSCTCPAGQIPLVKSQVSRATSARDRSETSPRDGRSIEGTFPLSRFPSKETRPGEISSSRFEKDFQVLLQPLFISRSIYIYIYTISYINFLTTHLERVGESNLFLHPKSVYRKIFESHGAMGTL